MLLRRCRFSGGALRLALQPTPVDIARCWPNLGRTREKRSRTRPNSVDIGPTVPEIVVSSTNLCKPGPESTKLGPIATDVDRDRPNFSLSQSPPTIDQALPRMEPHSAPRTRRTNPTPTRHRPWNDPNSTPKRPQVAGPTPNTLVPHPSQRSTRAPSSTCAVLFGYWRGAARGDKCAPPEIQRLKPVP